MRRYRCEYCGEPASTRDHLTPRKIKPVGTTVEACVDCNSTLGGLLITSVEDRRRYLRGVLVDRQTRHRGYDWSPRELRELGPELRVAIQQGQERSKVLARRVAFLSKLLGTP